MNHFLQICILFVVFFGTLAKDRLDKALKHAERKRARRLKILYWGALLTALATGVIHQGLELQAASVHKKQEQMRKAALMQYKDGQAFFLTALGQKELTKSLPNFEAAIPKLSGAADKFSQLPGDRFYETSARTAVGIAREKLAYAGATNGIIYFAVEGRILSFSSESGDDIKLHPATLKKGRIRCTDIADHDMWDSAREQYVLVLELLSESESSGLSAIEKPGDLVASARSVGYFLLCNYLRTGKDTLAKARKTFGIVKSITKPENFHLPHRYEDAVAKLHFLDVLKSSGYTIESISSVSKPKEAERMSSAEVSMKINIIKYLLPYNQRLEQRDTGDIDLIVVHCTELPSLTEARVIAEKILYNGSRTGNSGHYYIDRNGTIYQYSHDDRIAHHVIGYNERSIGIELVNLGRYPNWFHSAHQEPVEDYPPEQISSLIRLVRELKRRYPDINGITGHSDLDLAYIPAKDNPEVQIRRRIDPGPRFPWDQVVMSVELSKSWQEKNSN